MASRDHGGPCNPGVGWAPARRACRVHFRFRQAHRNRVAQEVSLPPRLGDKVGRASRLSGMFARPGAALGPRAGPRSESRTRRAGVAAGPPEARPASGQADGPRLPAPGQGL